MKNVQWTIYYAALVACFTVSLFAAPRVAAEPKVLTPAAVVSDLGAMTVTATRIP